MERGVPGWGERLGKTFMIENSSIIKFVRQIAETVDPDRVYLFGSYASGRAGEDSDIDILIIKDTLEPRCKRSIAIQKLLIGSKIPADIIVYTNDEFEKEKSSRFSFIAATIQNAQLMYERGH
jgi:predicted nucleotidyltransferase